MGGAGHGIGSQKMLEKLENDLLAKEMGRCV
jgi:hypothetical protein